MSTMRDDTFSLADISDHIDALIDMMKPHEEILYGVLDIVNEIRDEVQHILSQNDDSDE